MSDTSRDPKLLEPQLLAAWKHASRVWTERHPDGPVPFLTATHRGRQDQEVAYASGKSKARYGQSLHNYKPAYAFDVAFVTRRGTLDYDLGLFREFADLLEPFGLQWGGRWKDLVDGPHFQLPMTAADASAGKVPELPKLKALIETQRKDEHRPGSDAEWRVVYMLDGEVLHTADLWGRNVIQRVDPARKRVYVDARSG